MTSSDSTIRHSTDWAFNLFRPILKDLHLQSFENKTYLRTSLKKYNLIKYNMSRCVIIPVRYKFTNDNDKGVFVWTYNKKTKIFILYIVINENMYGNKLEHVNCVKRKLVTTHEFIHCVAAMLSISCVASEDLIGRLQESMRKNIDVIQSVDIYGIMSEFKKEIKDINKNEKTNISMRKFDDEHFRTGYENIEGSYYDLNTNLLFSKQLFEEYFTKDKLQSFKELMKQGSKSEAVMLLIKATEEVINKKCLDKDFVVEKMQTDILPAYFNEVAEYVKTKNSNIL